MTAESVQSAVHLPEKYLCEYFDESAPVSSLIKPSVVSGLSKNGIDTEKRFSFGLNVGVIDTEYCG